MTPTEQRSVPIISLGILAWNEEDAIGATLQSIFRQSLFGELGKRGLGCEILCLPNGCTDDTAGVAAKIFQIQSRHHPLRHWFDCRVARLAEQGKINAWNAFVHTLSARESRCLILMDGDIVIHHPDTLWNLYVTLAYNPEAWVAVDQPLKDIALRTPKRWRERISLATSAMTQTGSAQLTGQLYAIKAEVARNLYLPKDLLVEDGFIKAVVCTDFLSRPPVPGRLLRASAASHIFEAYLSLKDIFKNQKRQMIAQTITHLLVDNHLKDLSPAEKKNLGATLKAKDDTDPGWLKRLIGDHIRRTRFFWQLFPGLLTFRFQRLARLNFLGRVTHLPAAVAGTVVTLVASWLAHDALRRGYTNYWPDTKSRNLQWLGRVRPATPRAESLANPVAHT
ncbi:MAG: glycosyltransferase family 2 protein [Limisphaerales bacterium]